MKWIKGLLVVLAVLIVGGIVFSAVGWMLYRSAPDWYQSNGATDEERAAAAQRAEDKFIETRNWAAQSHARDSARRNNPPADEQETQPEQEDEIFPPMTVSFTQRELNAFFQKAADLHEWGRAYDPYIDNPRVVLHGDRIILAALVRDLDAVMSVQFRPRLDADGRLELRLLRVTAGRLPLPEAMWAQYRDELKQALEDALPAWQSTAEVDEAGISNSAAIAAAMSALAIAALERESADPILFLPLDNRRGMAVKLTDLRVTDRELSVSLSPLSPEERDTLIQNLRDPDTTATVWVD